MELRFNHPWIRAFMVVIVTGSVLLGGCTQAPDSSAEPGLSASAPEVVAPNLPRLTGSATVEMVINGATVMIEVDGEQAPITAGNFVDLVDKGFYDGLSFHRVIKAPEPFVAQGGDPKGNGTGGYINPETSQERYIPLEIKVKNEDQPIYGQAIGRQGSNSNAEIELKHTRGAIAMARSQPPNSASSQFYFALADLPFLDGDYAVFGYITGGMDVVDDIEQGDRITSAKVTSGLDNLQR